MAECQIAHDVELLSYFFEYSGATVIGMYSCEIISLQTLCSQRGVRNVSWPLWFPVLAVLSLRKRLHLADTFIAMVHDDLTIYNADLPVESLLLNNFP